MSYLSFRYKVHVQNLRPVNSERLPVLPPETIDYIISFLQGAPSTLYNCALTCRAWHPASQHHLFRSISIRSRSGLQTFVCRVLQDEPHMKARLRLVRSLRVAEQEKEPFAHLIPHHFVGHLTNLRSIRFQSIDWTSGYPHHPSFSMTLSGFTSITRLILFDCKFPHMRELARLVSAFPQLSDLYIFSRTWIHPDEFPNHGIIPQLSRVRRPRLTVLSLNVEDSRYLTAVFTWLLRTQSATSITHLEIRPLWDNPRKDLLALGMLIYSLRGSLTHLVVPLDPSFDGVNALTSLHTLCFCDSRPPNAIDIWTKLASIISQIKSRLHQLTVIHNVKSPEHKNAEAEWHDGVTTFDEALCREHFQDLEEVKLILSVQCTHAAAGRLLRETQQGLVRLRRRGIVTVNVHRTGLNRRF